MLETRDELRCLSKKQLVSAIITKQRIINHLEKEVDEVKQSMYDEFKKQLEIGQADDYSSKELKMDKILKIAKRNADELDYELNEDFIPNDEKGKIIELPNTDQSTK